MSASVLNVSLKAFLAITFASVFMASAAEAVGYEVPLKEGDTLLIKGMEAQIQLTNQPGATALKVFGPDQNQTEGAYVIEKKGHVIEIRMNEFENKKAWSHLLPKANTQAKKIEISGPSIPVDVHLFGGSVNSQRWARDMKVSMTNGRFTSSNGVGSLQVYLQKGDITISDHTGKVTTDSYSGNTTLRNIQGDVDASLFSGLLNIDKAHGFLAISTQQATGKLQQSSGTVQFENGKGNLNIQTFQGRIEGQSLDGSVTVVMGTDSEVDIKSKAGRINVHTQPNSGASVNLQTAEGDIFVPKELRVNTSSSEKNVRGRLHGDGQGSILVRSQEGTITVK